MQRTREKKRENERRSVALLSRKERSGLCCFLPGISDLWRIHERGLFIRVYAKTKDRFTLTKELRMMLLMSTHTQTHSIASSRPNGHRPSSFKRGRDAVQNPARIEEDETTGKRLDVEKLLLLLFFSFFCFFIFFLFLFLV